MMKMMTISDAARWLAERDRFCLLTHCRPDGDTVGSAAALCLGLRQLGKTAHLLKNQELAGNLSFLQEAYNEMLINAGAEVCVLEPDREYRAQAVGINRNGELIVRTAQGEEKAVYAGEVSVRGVYGYV